MEKVIRDGQVAVVYSPGFGAGWYSWNLEYPELVFDPMVVHCIESQDSKKLETYMALKYPDVYTGGIDSLSITWIPIGTQFKIDEYDGSESVHLATEIDWFTA